MIALAEMFDVGADLYVLPNARVFARIGPGACVIVHHSAADLEPLPADQAAAVGALEAADRVRCSVVYLGELLLWASRRSPLAALDPEDSTPAFTAHRLQDPQRIGGGVYDRRLGAAVE